MRGFQWQFSGGGAFAEFQMHCAPSSGGKLKCHRICCFEIQPFFLNKPLFGCCIPWRRDRLPIALFLGVPGGSDSKESPAVQETWVQSLGWEDPLEKGMATHSSILAWRIPWTEEPGRLQSMGSQKWVTFTHSSLLLTSRILKKLILPVLSLVLWRSGKSLISHLGSASLWWLLKYFVNYLAFSSYSSGTVSCLSSLQCPETEVKNQFYVCINPR